MRVPLSWLKDYVPLPASPADLIERLTLAGLEAASVNVVGLPVPPGLRVKPEDATPVWERDTIVAAKVLKIEKHPDADKLKLVTCDYGASEPKTVVTGAPNIAPGQSGMTVILGLKGSRYFYTDKDGTKKVFTLEPKALRGIMNDAMCMSNFELGIAEDHDGIIILDDGDAKPGTPAQDILGDIIVDLDVLPNMARCLGLLGVAREVAALTGASVKVPEVMLEDRAGTVDIAIADPNLSRRYVGYEIEGVTIGPAPRWMRSRLQAAGMRPISNIVDITNYVMLETGQPLHAFDLDVLKTRAGGKTPMIAVRSALPGETLKTLDGVERKLGPENLVIADSLGPIALAGVMGGFDTEVTDKTKSILLEAAHFDFVSVRKTARQFNLFSEASTRFSRGIHPELAMQAGLRAADLIVKHAKAKPAVGITDHYAAQLTLPNIDLNRSEIERLLGTTMPDGEVERILTALDFKLDATPWGWSVTPPSNRLDIQSGPADLIEDLARVSGYDRLPERLLEQEMPTPVGNRSLELEELVRDRLVVLGLSECITYSLTGPGPGEFVALLNPISPERSALRQSLVPGLLEVAKRHLEAQGSAAIFEIGSVYLPAKGLPDEPRRLAIVLAGRRNELAWDNQKSEPFDFYDLKGMLEGLFHDLHLENVSYSAGKDPVHLHPARSATISLNETELGQFGELHPKIANVMGFGDETLLVASLDLEALLKLVPARVQYLPFSTFPPAKRDVAVIVPDSTTAERVQNEIRAAGGDLLVDVSLFDVYHGDSIPAGTKSLAYALTYQAADRTLGDKEIQKAHEKVESRLKHVLGAQIRGKE